MSESLPGSVEPLGDKPPGPRSNTYELVEGRTNYRMWVPRYINGQFATRIGDGGIAVYSSLAWWLTSDAPHHRPTLTEIGQHAGCSRATVWRVLKVLVANGLIELVPTIGTTGRRAHQIRLVHPQEVTGKSEESGIGVAGGSNLSAPRAQDERAARSNRARGALNPSAPSDCESDLKVCVNAPAGDTHTSAPPQQIVTLGEIADFVVAWQAALKGGSARFVKSQTEEARIWAPQLLALGWTLPELLAEVARPSRAANEWPREFAARLGAPKRQTGLNPAEVAEQAHKRAEEAQRLSAEQQGAQWQENMRRLRERIGRMDAPAPASKADGKR